MVSVHFNDWRKNLTKEDKERMYEMEIFELIFSAKATELGLNVKEHDLINIYCIGRERSPFTVEKLPHLNQMRVKAPYNYQNFMDLESTREKFEEFKRLIHLYVVPLLLESLPMKEEEILKIIDLSLEQIAVQDYEAVFLVGKTPKKSPSRKKVALLRGVHRVEGFQLYCEVFNEHGKRITNKLLVETVPTEAAYSRFLGELKWQSESLIVVKSPYSSWQATIEV